MAILKLESGEQTVSIDTRGAWVRSWEYEGRELLFPKTTITSPTGAAKERGGCHVCLPNFGPGGESGQAQHGYGRELEWEVRDAESTATNISLYLDHGTDRFNALSSHLSYELTTDSLLMKLIVKNKGDEPLPLSTGFHPYFVTGDAKEIAINEQVFSLDQLTDARFLDGDSMSLRIADTEYSLQSEGLNTWALWTDRLAKYVCLEPTADGFGFQNGSAAAIEPGQAIASAFSMRPIVAV